MQIQIKKLGKVEEANIELKPLTIFVGENNTGKTYVASAIWYLFTEISNHIEDFIPKHIKNKLQKKIETSIKEIFNNQNPKDDEVSIKLEQKDIKNFFNKINECLQQKTSELLASCFNLNLEHFEKTQFIFFEDNLKNLDIKINFNFSKKVEKIDGWEELNVWEYEVAFNNNKIEKLSAFFISPEFNEINKENSGNIIREIFIHVFFKNLNFKPEDFIYIPAARTGLLLGVHDIVQNYFFNSINRIVRGRGFELNLTKPLEQFINKINQTRSGLFRNVLHQKAETISEQNKDFFTDLLAGKIQLNDTSQAFEYKPKNLDKNLPLSASSSLVTELAPLQILDGHLRENNIVFIEEPEAHLHLSAQRQMAKKIIEMVNSGMYVVLTTHSDTFVQQINNLVLLNEISSQNHQVLEKYKVVQNQTLAKEQACMYDFNCETNKTQVEKIEFGEYGFVPKSLNKVLQDLIQETNSIIDEIDNLSEN